MECLARNEIKLILMKGALPKGLLTVLDEFGISAITVSSSLNFVLQVKD